MEVSDPGELMLLLMYAYMQGKTDGLMQAVEHLAETWPLEEENECGSSSLDS